MPTVGKAPTVATSAGENIMPEKTSWEKQIIDAGFKALAKKHHPDVEGGSEEAMKELGAARDRLNCYFSEWNSTFTDALFSQESILRHTNQGHPRIVNTRGQVVYNIDPQPVIDFVESLFGGPRRKGTKRK